jgi:hypothetical protein
MNILTLAAKTVHDAIDAVHNTSQKIRETGATAVGDGTKVGTKLIGRTPGALYVEAKGVATFVKNKATEVATTFKSESPELIEDVRLAKKKVGDGLQKAKHQLQLGWAIGRAKAAERAAKRHNNRSAKTESVVNEVVRVADPTPVDAKIFDHHVGA